VTGTWNKGDIKLPTAINIATPQRNSITFEPLCSDALAKINVRSWRMSGRHLLMLSVSQFFRLNPASFSLASAARGAC
jgi:hypothetical protein